MKNMDNSGEAPHPGKRIRTEIIPKGMSVTKAAGIIGVSRPALSNLLNGNASLSADMAARLEKAFGHKRETLLKLQADYDAAQANHLVVPSGAMPYVAPFLGVKANQIEQWASTNINARARLAVFFRTLVNSTGKGLTKVDFPGNDDSQRAGWDGFVEASEATPWIPPGRSGWEFGVNEDIKGKADDDFDKSVLALDKAERSEITFVFVTPRRWPRKAAWIKEAQAKKQWRNVVVYDASDIEQWLEQSIAGQTWFSNEIAAPSDGVRTLEKCWNDWAAVTSPPLNPALFSPAIEEWKKTLDSQFARISDGPIFIAADSAEEALAFVSQVFSELGGDRLKSLRDRVLVFDKPGVLPRLLQGTRDFIPVVHSREIERELASIVKEQHCIIVYPRNLLSEKPHVLLEPIDYEPFKKALEGMQKNSDAISRLGNETGRSLTVLRRRLATVPSIQRPEWAASKEASEKLIPLALVGAWNASNETDRTVIEMLADKRSYEEIERNCQELAHMNDAPVWSVGNFRGVVSKIDALFATAPFTTKHDLERYFKISRIVLGEPDPSLDLPEDKRWYADIYGKKREFSGALRKGFAETLVLLAVHGNALFKQRLGIDTEFEASRVVKEMLREPLELRALEENDRDLPTYAEAAPETFLTLLEDDLRLEQPVALGLLRPASRELFGGISRTGLLWALEGLCWNSEMLPRAALALAQLSVVEIDDNWNNKPINSLTSVFRAWMPQTAADHDARVEVVKKIIRQFPEIGWKLCISQFGSNSEVGHHNHKPVWRTDGYGHGDPLPIMGPIMKFRCEMVELTLNWNGYTPKMLCDLIERLHGLGEEFQRRVWEIVGAWAKTNVTDADKGIVREKIRVTVLSKRAARRLKKGGEELASLTKCAKEVFDALEPTDILNRHAWLFQKAWIEESADELYGNDDTDYRKRDERISKLRTEALQEIVKRRGLEGLLELAELGEAAWQIGWLAAGVVSTNRQAEFLRLAAQEIVNGQASFNRKNLAAGFIRSIQDEAQRSELITQVISSLSDSQKADLLKLAPFERATWEFVDAIGTEGQVKYWSEVNADWNRDSHEENREAVKRLLKANRPRAAFACISLEPAQLEGTALFELLSAIAIGGEDKPGHYQLEEHYVREAMKIVSASNDLSMDQKAILEFKFLEVLSRKWGDNDGHSIANLERYIELHPEMYVQAIVWAYKRKDGGVDPEEFKVAPEFATHMAERSYKLLEALERMPGHDREGVLKADLLLAWIKTVRNSCQELSRGEIGDQCIGKLMSSAPVGDDGIWPCEPVRVALEEVHSDEIMQGTRIGLFNARGVHSRGRGGDQEREIASKYRKWAEPLQLKYPYVYSRLLMEMARNYEQDATREDEEDDIRMRLG